LSLRLVTMRLLQLLRVLLVMLLWMSLLLLR